MSLRTSDMLMIGGGLLAVVAGLYIWKKGGVAGAAAGAASAVVNAATGAATGTVLGIGDAIGVPRTDQTECEKALAEGRTWDASFACPAGQFLGSIFSSNPNGSTGSGGVDPIDFGYSNPMGDRTGW